MSRQDKSNLVAVGGGCGLATLLRGLKHAVGERLEELTAIVTVADDGGSSGRLRRDFGVLPPGDIRNCLVALARDEHLVARLFQYRFAGGQGLAGHSFGNLLLTALTGITGDFYQAILTAEELLSVRGRILPDDGISGDRVIAWPDRPVRFNVRRMEPRSDRTWRRWRHLPARWRLRGPTDRDRRRAGSL